MFQDYSLSLKEKLTTLSKLTLLSNSLLTEYSGSIDFDIEETVTLIEADSVPVDFFQFYNSVSSVYSSKIEGENIDFDSYYKHKFLNVKYKPDYTKKSDDLLLAYEFTLENKLSFENVLKTHSILSRNLLPKNQRGLIRNNPMLVLNSDDRIEYVAAEPNIVKSETQKLFLDISILLNDKLSLPEIFYYAAYIHLVFVKIHPFQDGNGRTARLIEKWFLIEKLGKKIISIELEKNYYKNLSDYYKNIRKLGLEYSGLDYTQSLDFLTMTISGLKTQTKNH
jgi:Fic family protein